MGLFVFTVIQLDQKARKKAAESLLNQDRLHTGLLVLMRFLSQHFHFRLGDIDRLSELRGCHDPLCDDIAQQRDDLELQLG